MKSREEYRKERALEEARKAGKVAPLRDEDGKDINPHIPQYIAQAPWYLNNDQPSLKHQRALNAITTTNIDDWYERGKRAGPAVSKFRKGACTNCGAMTHKARDCCERPRKIGARWKEDDIKPDELVADISLDFDGKHDRWNGYDSTNHLGLMKEYEIVNEEKKKRKFTQEQFMTEPDPGHERYPHSKLEKHKKGKDSKLVDSDSDPEDDKHSGFKEDGTSAVEQAKDPKTRTTVRNLRIREDTAKYLRNLDLNSAYYDPKSRSMRENPTPNKTKEELVYAGDNFLRETGDSLKFTEMQTFAWDATDKGALLHLEASPSKSELAYKKYQATRTKQFEENRKNILERYGGEDNLEKDALFILEQD